MEKLYIALMIGAIIASIFAAGGSYMGVCKCSKNK